MCPVPSSLKTASYVPLSDGSWHHRCQCEDLRCACGCGPCRHIQSAWRLRQGVSTYKRCGQPRRRCAIHSFSVKLFLLPLTTLPVFCWISKHCFFLLIYITGRIPLAWCIYFFLRAAKYWVSFLGKFEMRTWCSALYLNTWPARFECKTGMTYSEMFENETSHTLLFFALKQKCAVKRKETK